MTINYLGNNDYPWTLEAGFLDIPLKFHKKTSKKYFSLYHFCDRTNLFYFFYPVEIKKCSLIFIGKNLSHHIHVSLINVTWVFDISELISMIENSRYVQSIFVGAVDVLVKKVVLIMSIEILENVLPGKTFETV